MKEVIKLGQIWYSIDWRLCHEKVAQQQHRIVVAFQENKLQEVRRLQEGLVDSFAARAIAVRKVTQVNQGKNTPGVDRIVVLTPQERMQLVKELMKHREMKPSPVRRVWLSKDGKPIKADRSNARPLGIPTVYDRAAQALWRLALQPIAEHMADDRSYGYRPYRGAHDQMSIIYRLMRNRWRTNWVLEGDIKGFFDNITHEWILKNVPMNKTVLKGWLKAGYIDQFRRFDTEMGVPQGGVISPIIANMVLDGLQEVVRKAAHKYFRRVKPAGAHLIRYADDFVVLCKSKTALKESIVPAIQEFLGKRGLWLHPTKTVISHVTNGFDFLGFNTRIYARQSHATGYRLFIKPSKKRVQRFKDKAKRIFSSNPNHSAYQIIYELNPIIRGWGNYYRVAVSKRIFTKLDWFLWRRFYKWATRKHPILNASQVYDKYTRRSGGRKSVFYGILPTGEELQLLSLRSIPIKRAPWIKDQINPFLLQNREYFTKRKRQENLNAWDKQRQNLLKRQNGICAVCNQLIDRQDERMEIHHITPKRLGGTNSPKNLVPLHRECHRQLTLTKSDVLKARFMEMKLVNNIQRK